MNSILYFEHIVIPVPYESVYQRLGFYQGITRLDDAKRLSTEQIINRGTGFISLKAAALRSEITSNSGTEIVLDTGTVFRSGHVAKMLAGSTQALLMGATAGTAIMDEIKGLCAAGDLAHAVIFDALASEMVDGVLRWIGNYFNHIVSRESMRVSQKRFSCGYGDFVLENQKEFYRLLGMSSLGVSINESCILLPEKSVTAITGILGVDSPDI